MEREREREVRSFLSWPFVLYVCSIEREQRGIRSKISNCQSIGELSGLLSGLELSVVGPESGERQVRGSTVTLSIQSLD